MKLINANCPNCGAALEFDADDTQTVCEYCDSVIILDDESRSKAYKDAGYNFEMGRQKAREELGEKYIPQNTYESEEPKKRKTWLWVLGWIFIFPVPLSIIVARSKKLAVWLKAVIIIAAWLLYIIWVGYTNQQDAQNAAAAQGNETTSYSQTVTE
ncbi:MAG: TFIIB-type zinc ribbon-containing protein [Clostridia bacterium]|nr:TFIIB-type zinc ribbon-containing protein [Clostridia bacterium]